MNRLKTPHQRTFTEVHPENSAAGRRAGHGWAESWGLRFQTARAEQLRSTEGKQRRLENPWAGWCIYLGMVYSCMNKSLCIYLSIYQSIYLSIYAWYTIISLYGQACSLRFNRKGNLSDWVHSSDIPKIHYTGRPKGKPPHKYLCDLAILCDHGPLPA